MTEEETIVPVLFRAGKRGYFEGDVTAVFPTLPESNQTFTCYVHIGQHGACARSWYLQDTRPATEDEYAPLKSELESIGYRLKVIKRWPS